MCNSYPTLLYFNHRSSRNILNDTVVQVKTGTSRARRFSVCAAVQNINKAKYFLSEWQRSRPRLVRGRRGIMREKCHIKPPTVKSALVRPPNTVQQQHGRTFDHNLPSQKPITRWWHLMEAGLCVRSCKNLILLCCCFIFAGMKLF